MLERLFADSIVCANVWLCPCSAETNTKQPNHRTLAGSVKSRDTRVYYAKNLEWPLKRHRYFHGCSTLGNYRVCQIPILLIQRVTGVSRSPQIQSFHRLVSNRCHRRTSMLLQTVSDQPATRSQGQTLHFWHAKRVELCFWLWNCCDVYPSRCLFVRIPSIVHVHAEPTEEVLC